MKVVLLTSDYNISANIAIRAFLENPAINKHDIEIEGIVLSDRFNLKPRALKTTLRFLRTSGLMFFLKNIITTMWKMSAIWIAKWLFKPENREFLGIPEMAKKYNIPLLQTENVNSDESKKFLKNINPSYLVSCYLLDIIKKEVLDIPKHGSINIHPGLTQMNRGIFCSFWTLVNKWQKTGVTVHYMTEKVDEGEVILQKRFFVFPKDTFHYIDKKAATIGGNLLVKSLVNLKKKRVRAFKMKRLGKMFTIPTYKDVKRFYAQGKRLIRAREFFKV